MVATSHPPIQLPKPGLLDNPLGIRGIDHIEFYVNDAGQWADYHEKMLGMRRRCRGDSTTGLVGRRAIVVGQGRIHFLFAEPEGASAAAEDIRTHLARHGNGVKDIAFRVKDVAAAVAHATSAGAKIVRPIDEHEVFIGASIAAYGDTTHTFLQRKPHADFAPGYVNVAGGMEDEEIQLMMIDHIVANVEHMDEWCDFYARVFGFEQTAHFDIQTGRSALMSKVMGDVDGYIRLPINEPSSEKSQIQEFIDEYKGPGIQHIALLTPDIIATVREMRGRGMKFLDVPDTYFEMLPQRVGQIRENIQSLRELGILVDRDREDGYLLQLFSQPIFDRPTLFYEIIQRRGNSDGFGEGNFRALFEAIEREQMKRGTL
ncbi:MAG TPA: 4-hydroxyphenylpyruvate dioxygenase [Tepidisphaeraceae bacterium]|jgi:4-hydroxyphenylpyruvate dioxygenase|nr:4-hydroxyphenylpyruvate dioxygenase [Tepidisphaeraceae bacterium]